MDIENFEIQPCVALIDSVVRSFINISKRHRFAIASSSFVIASCDIVGVLCVSKFVQPICAHRCLEKKTWGIGKGIEITHPSGRVQC